MRELSVQEQGKVSGGSKIAEFAGEGGALGTVVGGFVKGSLRGASRGGITGALYGGTFGAGYEFGNWLYEEVS